MAVMKRILFVDDEPRVLQGLQDLLARRRSSWEMVFAANGEATLEAFRRSRFDVIVADIRMPGMDGVALLERIRTEFPQTVRIVLSGQPEAELGIRALPVCHQFLSKPCDPDVLVNAVDRSCRLQELVEDEAVRKIVGGMSRLPALPSVYAELQTMLADESAGASDVARVVARDIALSAKVLQMVNSAFFGLGRRITAISEAVVYIGVPMIQQLVLAASVFGGIKLRADCGVDLDRMRDHALLTAAIAKDIAKDIPSNGNPHNKGRNRASEAWTAGLLHDAGKLVLAAGLPDHLPAAIAHARGNQQPCYEAERELYGVTHAEIGAYLLGTWGLPHTIVEAVANHHFPGRAQPRKLDLVVAVHVADVLAHEREAADAVTREAEPTLDTELLESLNLIASLEKWRTSARASGTEPSHARR